MKKILLMVILGGLLVACGGATPTLYPTYVPCPTPTAVPSATSTSTPTFTPEPTPAHTATAIPTETPIVPTPTPSAGYPGPIMISASNYQSFRGELLPYRPFMVYAWATNPSIGLYDGEIARLAEINDAGVEEIMMFSSWRTLEEKLSQPGHADYLHSIGVTKMGYNSEGGMTPQDEMNNLGSTSPATNSVVQFVNIAKTYGFEVVWGPIRRTADTVPDAAVRIMFEADLDEIGLQEQRFIEAACVNERVAAVNSTVNRYQGQAGAHPFQVTVQIMPSRCVVGDNYARQNCPAENITYAYQHCGQFVDEIEPIIDSLAMWASGSSDRAQLVNFIRSLRGGTDYQ